MHSGFSIIQNGTFLFRSTQIGLEYRSLLGYFIFHRLIDVRGLRYECEERAGFQKSSVYLILNRPSHFSMPDLFNRNMTDTNKKGSKGVKSALDLFSQALNFKMSQEQTCPQPSVANKQKPRYPVVGWTDRLCSIFLWTSHMTLSPMTFVSSQLYICQLLILPSPFAAP